MVRRSLFALLLLLLLIPGGTLSLVEAEDTSQLDLAKALIGTWVAVGDGETLISTPEQGGSLKSFTGRHWNVSLVDPATGLVAQNHGGSYTLDGDRYVETVEYASSAQKALLGKSFTLRLKVDGDRLTQTAVDNPWHQALVRRK